MSMDFKEYRFTNFSSFKKYDSWIEYDQSTNPLKFLELNSKSSDIPLIVLLSVSQTTPEYENHFKNTDLYPLNDNNFVRYKGGIFNNGEGVETLLFFDSGMILIKGLIKSKGWFSAKTFSGIIYLFRYDYRKKIENLYSDELTNSIVVDKNGKGFCSRPTGIEFDDFRENIRRIDFNKKGNVSIETGYEYKSYYYKRRIGTHITHHTGSITIKSKDIHESLQDVIKPMLDFEKKLKNEEKLNKEKRIKSLKKSQSKILDELDKDGNGIIDIIEGNDDFMKLFRKHQILIKEFDKHYINNLVKISNYLKTKRKNIQKVFTEIVKTENETELENNVGLIKNQIHTYELILYHSLQLINSIVQDDFVTVNEIYEEFDRLKIFKSDHEKEVSEKLTDIKVGLVDLLSSINLMERNIVGGLNELSYMTGEGFSNLNSSLKRELKNIQSGIGFNNLLTGIQTYQMYKINKNTKSLRN